MKKFFTLLFVLASAVSVFAESSINKLPDQTTVVLQPMLAFGEFRTLSKVVLVRKPFVTARLTGLLVNRCVDRTLRQNAPCVLANDYREFGVVPSEVSLTDDGKLQVKLDLASVRSAIEDTKFSDFYLRLQISNSSMSIDVNLQSEIENSGVVESSYQISWLNIEDLQVNDAGSIVVFDEH